ncbi:SPOR domain-containing protein [Arenimonas sp. MALMAid1274]|uniref:SPOR domain-containing protein n=1 Tax=Arenimonas sp. MALMAid1274 TaxID=3411630 RepID=UPI003BA25496
MDSALKQRLIGAAVLVALAMIFLPMLLRGPDAEQPDAAQVPLDMPAAPDQEFETRELPLTVPQPQAPEGGVVGMDTGPRPSDDPNAVATVDQTGAPAARTDYAPVPEGEDGTLAPVDAATGLAQSPSPPSAPAPTAPAVPPDAASPVTPPAAAPPPVASTPAAAGGRYMVNVGSFSNLANARALADKLRSRGLPLTSESVDVSGKPAMRLRVGPYGDRAAAEAARLRVDSVTGGGANVIALDGSAAPAPARATPAAAAVATPAQVPVPARASTAANVGFAVQLGALSSEADASALRDRARAAGFVAFHQRVNTERGAVWRVRVGPEADRAAAERLRESVAGKLGMKDAIVVPHP